MPKSNYHVIKNKDSRKWMVKRAGSSRSSGSFNSQRDAEKVAKKFAANAGGGEVRIHNRRGMIRGSDTVAPRNGSPH